VIAPSHEIRCGSGFHWISPDEGLKGAKRSGMSVSTPLLERLLQSFCRHQFSWPHTGIHGQDYQVCLICGVAYSYDWATMRRTGRIAIPAEDGRRSSAE
jgi:hypothetical protein